MSASAAPLSPKSCAIKPLKLSPALGGALAFLGLDRALPLLHGSQGCTAFALVLAVRHFREAIPLQTTAMSEISTILVAPTTWNRPSTPSLSAPSLLLSASAQLRSPKHATMTSRVISG